MKNVLVIALLVSAPCVYAQTWHAALDTLKSPQSKFHTQVSMGFNNGYDTVRCLYKVSGNDTRLKGYKYVFVLDGFYIDTPGTINVFFDDRKQRIINKVESYCFN